MPSCLHSVPISFTNLRSVSEDEKSVRICALNAYLIGSDIAVTLATSDGTGIIIVCVVATL